MQTETISICTCASRSFIEKKKVATIAATLDEKGHKIKLLDDLCHIISDEPLKAKEIAKGTILACHSRAVSSLFESIGVENTSARIINIRNQSTDAILNHWQYKPVDNNTEQYNYYLTQTESLPTFDGSDAWYPVIDKSKCTECGKCHDFCLFGVYSINNKKVEVTQPHNCKNNCPACARMCPSHAIIFPKYDKSPINGGTEIEEEFSEADMEEMYQKRLEYRLQQNRKRFSLLKKDNQ